MASAEQIASLRPMINEMTQENYTDEVLGLVIDQAENNLNVAAHVIWDQKAGKFSTLVDVSESGSSRSNSQIYRNASDRAKYYLSLVQSETEVVEPEDRPPRTRTAVRR